MPQIAKITDLVDWRLCLGCGACAYICPQQKVTLMDFFAEGIRPVVDTTSCGSCRECLDVCPAVHSDFSVPHSGSGSDSQVSLGREWGPVVAIWEGHAVDPAIRYHGSSGGALTAIGTYCLEVLGMPGVLHIAQDPEEPIRNRTRLSRTREELLAATGSRYSPASVCNGLGLVEAASAPCVVIGQPAEIAAVRNACKLRPAIARKVGVALSFFCAGSPSTRGTLDLLEKLGVNPTQIRTLRYRGQGWPGHFAPVLDGESLPCHRLPYRESWAFLQAYRPWSVQLWPDGAGELADISCGDPWYAEPDGENPGFSLVLARTAHGREIVEGAIKAGYLSLKPAEGWKVVQSQKGLLQKKGAVWGRRWAMHLLGLPTTKIEGLELSKIWRQLSFKDQLRSTLGTIRRILTRKLYRSLKLNPLESERVKPAMIGIKGA